MLHPSTKRLIDKLGDMTRRQRVTWQEAENGQMTHDTEGYRVTLTPDPYAVLLTDAQGREIETCSPSDFNDEFDADGRPYALFVEELYREAKRHARGAEEAISAVLAGLTAVETDVRDEPADLIDDADAEVMPGASGEDAVEDPLDDSSPLEPEAYLELDSQSDITSAVASLASQVNTPLEAQPVEHEAPEEISEDTLESPIASRGDQQMPSEDEILTDENTGISLEEAVADSAHEVNTVEDAEPTEEATPEAEASMSPIMGYGVSSPDAPAAMEPVDEPGPLNEPAAGYTPTGYTEIEPEDASTAEADAPQFMGKVDSEVTHEADTYTPAFADASDSAPNYAQAEPFDSYIPESEPEIAPSIPEGPAIEAASAPEEEAGEPSPAPQENAPTSNNFLTGGYGSGLGRYAPQSDTAQSHSEMETSETPETEPQLEAAPTPELPAQPPQSFSLSGIGNRQAPVETPAPLDATESVESVSAPRVVIDATHDQPWPGTEPVDSDEHTSDAETHFEAAEPHVEPEVEITPEPDFIMDTQTEPADTSSSEEKAQASEEVAPRPVKRFNPWN
ncbi:hypothetical protein L53_11405 [Hyphomonas sp. L-53-1-40]|uniref:hypothetical protein n=1 Tax=Hyphomonas sp. L-53-1-40 TaxID=1207058 RepID=UPI000458B518|nr:hypothetical protein [Hyphomonas sp. L-53-1-40]KCZ62698.1 hypothetical protein L53_11405 [Hyphomonas sp. L-53-1-40]